jgi:predicted PurR-regulated permease PerM
MSCHKPGLKGIMPAQNTILCPFCIPEAVIFISVSPCSARIFRVGGFMNWFNWRNTKWGSYTFAICAGVLLFVVLENIGSILKAIGTFIGFFGPVIVGAVMAYVMDFFVKFIEKYLLSHKKFEKHSRGIAVAINTILVVALFVLLNIAVIPQIVSGVTGLVTNWDSYVNELLKFINSFNGSVDVSDITEAIYTVADTVGTYISENSGNIVDTITNAGTTAINWIISFFIAIYFLLAKDNLMKGFARLFRMWMNDRNYLRSNAAFHRINDIFSRYIVCEIVDAFIIGISNAVFMTITGMPYIALVSVVVGVTNLAPTFGPIVGGVIGSFILLLVHPVDVIWFIIFTIILQTIDGYIIKPKMYGGALSVPSVWILVAIIVLGRMFGVTGILLAIPVAAIITYWLRDFLQHQETEEQQDKKFLQ